MSDNHEHKAEENRQSGRRGTYGKHSLEIRNSVIRLYTNNHSVPQIASKLSVPKSTIKNIIKRFVETGSTGVLAKGGAHNIKCTAEMRMLMKELLNEQCTRKLKYLQEKIFERFYVRLCLSAIKANLDLINFSIK